MQKVDLPLAFWNYFVERRANSHELTATNKFIIYSSNPHTILIEKEGDILNTCQFGWRD